MRHAAAPPAQRCQDRNTRHRRAATRPATTPKARNSTLILFCRPMPATSPNSSHRRVSPVRRARAEMSHSAAQNRMSNAFIDRMPQIPRYAGASAVASAAANCAYRAPPISRARRAASATVAAWATAGSSRAANSESPERGPHQPRDESNHGRVLDVPEAEMLGGREVVEFVPEEAVPAVGHELKSQRRERHEPAGDGPCRRQGTGLVRTTLRHVASIHAAGRLRRLDALAPSVAR